MKLYFSPGACSLSPHIVLLEAGLAFEAERVDLASKRTAGGADFYAIQPQGYVPALQLDHAHGMLADIDAQQAWFMDGKHGSSLAAPSDMLVPAPAC